MRCIKTNDGSVLWQCPGCGHVHAINVNRDRNPCWTWNGDFERPVFGPSVLVQWDGRSPQRKAEMAAFEQQHGRRPTAAEMNPFDVKHVCHVFVGCNGAEPGQIHFLGDCTHSLAGQVVDMPIWSDDD